MGLPRRVLNKIRKTLKGGSGSALPVDMEPEFASLYAQTRPYSMTSVERMYTLYKAVEHVVRTGTAGDLVECGVWKGGSAMMMALALAKLGDSGRRIHLYDTFTGMTMPGKEDQGPGDADATAKWRRMQQGEHNQWCYSPLDEVRQNLARTGYPAEQLVFVPGKVEDTIPGSVPTSIALLRLDTDWYASTRHELEHLYPLLQPGGVLIIDDYGHWKGARQATDEFIARTGARLLLTRVDYSCRVAVKPND
jgi:predicted O-methyltransferase YrrM